ncbi:MAG: beta-lactamase family protein [Flavobacteriales bacterium]|nr:beta-lactamase family protein [Flavobacteriales bacterium]
MIRSRKVLITFIILTFASCNTAIKPNENDALVQELTDSLTFLSKTADFNGFGVAVVGPQGVLYTNGFGLADVAKGIPYTERTVQPIASISKTFIGLAVLKAQELGKLKLDDPCRNSCPSWSSTHIIRKYRSPCGISSRTRPRSWTRRTTYSARGSYATRRTWRRTLRLISGSAASVRLPPLCPWKSSFGATSPRMVFGTAIPLSRT